MGKMENKQLKSLLEQLLKEDHLIQEDRKKLLFLIADLIKEELGKNKEVNIVTVCTHNSRRSQLSEAWLVAGAQYFDLENINAYSGGTEATAFNIRMVVALRQKSFHLRTEGPKDNPKYTLETIHRGESPHTMFSKKYDHSFNPSEHFFAFMVCDHADQNCPIVRGALHRISLPYKDPKEFDDTPMENDAYLDKIDEIGREMLFLLKHI